MANDDVTVWFNPVCSKCKSVLGILADEGVDAAEFRYLERAPTRDELERVLRLLGTDDPRAICRTAEARFSELGLATATREQLLDALVANPVLIVRPIIVRGDRAVVGRPPERVLELLKPG